MQLKTIITVSLASMLLFSGGTALAINWHANCEPPEGHAKIKSGDSYTCTNFGVWKIHHDQNVKIRAECNNVQCENGRPATWYNLVLGVESKHVQCHYESYGAQCGSNVFTPAHITAKSMSCKCNPVSPKKTVAASLKHKKQQEFRFRTSAKQP